MQFVAGADTFLRVQMEPLSVLCVPRDRQRLQPSARQLDEVLLQRVHAKGVAHFVVVQLAVGSIGAYDELPAAPGEGRGNASVAEMRAVEVAEDRLLVGALHGGAVLRALPGGVFLRVTHRASRAANEARCGRWFLGP